MVLKYSIVKASFRISKTAMTNAELRDGNGWFGHAVFIVALFYCFPSLVSLHTP